MTQYGTIDILNRLIHLESRSLPAYLGEAAVFVGPEDERAAAVLANIQANQRGLVQQLANAVRSRRGRVETGSFPMTFTDLNFVSLGHVLPELLRYQRRDIAIIESCAQSLAREPEARALAEEVLGSEKAHLEQLEELLTASAGSAGA